MMFIMIIRMITSVKGKYDVNDCDTNVQIMMVQSCKITNLLHRKNLSTKHLHTRVAGVGWLSGTAAESLSAFVERVFTNFRDKNVVFYNCGKTGYLWLSKDLNTNRHVPSNTLFDV